VRGVEELLENQTEVKELPRRLCSEIQLFDLCELEKCHFKDDRFCTDPEMLARFEAAAEPEDRPVWHLGNDDDQDEDDLFNSEEFEDDDAESDDFDGRDRTGLDEEW